MLIELQNLEYDAESDEALKSLQTNFVKHYFFKFLCELQTFEKNNELHEVILNSLYFKQIKTNLLIK